MKKSVSDQIKDLENTRAARVARMEEVAEKAMEEGRSMDASEQEEFDDIQAEIKQLDGDITRYRSLEKTLAANAAPVEDRTKSVNDDIDGKAKGAKGPTIVTQKEKDDEFEGQSFTRTVIAKALAQIEGVSPIAIAEKRWGRSNPRLVEVIKTDVAGGGTGSGEWGSELVHLDRYMGDFQEYLYGRTVYNLLPLREVPANVNIAGQDGAATGYWVGESKAIPATKADFNDVNLTPKKVAALSVISNELIRDSAPSAEQLVRDALVEACAQRIDTTFLGTAAATAAAPAGILWNIAGTTSAGTDGDAVANDVKELMYRFTQAKNSGGLQFIMNPALATALGLMRNALDQYEFPTINEDGGTLFGRPVITGDNVNANHLILLKPSDIYRIGMGGLQVSMSQQATIEMADNPGADTDTPTAPTQKFVGMFQTESTAIKVVQSVNFARRREFAVAWIKDADYGGAIST